MKNELNTLQELSFISSWWKEDNKYFVDVDSDQGKLLLYTRGFIPIRKIPRGVTGERLIMMRENE